MSVLEMQELMQDIGDALAAMREKLKKIDANGDFFDAAIEVMDEARGVLSACYEKLHSADTRGFPANYRNATLYTGWAINRFVMFIDQQTLAYKKHDKSRHPEIEKLAAMAIEFMETANERLAQEY